MKSERIEFRVSPEERRAYDLVREPIPMGIWIRGILRREVEKNVEAARRSLTGRPGELADYLTAAGLREEAKRVPGETAAPEAAS